MNGNNVKVIRRWGRKYTPDELVAIDEGTGSFYGFGNPTLNINGQHRFRGKKTFEDQVFGDTDSNFLRSATLRGWNFYWVTGWGIPAGSWDSQAQPSVSVDTYTYFKDP